MLKEEKELLAAINAIWKPEDMNRKIFRKMVRNAVRAVREDAVETTRKIILVRVGAPINSILYDDIAAAIRRRK